MNPLKKLFPLAQPGDYATLLVAAAVVAGAIYAGRIIVKAVAFPELPAWFTSHLVTLLLGMGIGAGFMAILWPLLVIYFDPGPGQHPSEKVRK